MTDGAGEKFGQFLNSLGMIIGGMLIAFFRGWLLALILTLYLPVLLILVFIVRDYVKNAAIAKFMQGSKLGSHTEETLSALKLVVSFANEKKHIDQYKEVAD